MNFATIGELRKVFDDMQQKGIIGPYAVGGAFAATLHNEPIATADLDIFFSARSNRLASFLIYRRGPYTPRLLPPSLHGWPERSRSRRRDSPRLWPRILVPATLIIELTTTRRL